MVLEGDLLALEMEILQEEEEEERRRVVNTTYRNNNIKGRKQLTRKKSKASPSLSSNPTQLAQDRIEIPS